MTQPAQKKAPAHFVWRIRASEGVELTGEKKAVLADKMTEIAELASDGNAEIRISYDTNEVIASISAKATEAMRERALAKALALANNGLTGAISRVLLFFFRLGKEGREQLIARLADEYLNDERGLATEALEKRLVGYIAATENSRIERIGETRT